MKLLLNCHCRLQRDVCRRQMYFSTLNRGTQRSVFFRNSKLQFSFGPLLQLHAFWQPYWVHSPLFSSLPLLCYLLHRSLYTTRCHPSASAMRVGEHGLYSHVYIVSFVASASLCVQMRLYHHIPQHHISGAQYI